MWDTTIVTPSPDAVRLELDRVLASSTFTGSPRLSRFLRFVVERTLAGEGERLKEYVIGVAVFDRDGEYDPRVDSIVRVEAGRLRTKLEEYYQRAGAADPVIISIQRGGYVPVFDERPAQTAAVKITRRPLPLRLLGATTAVALVIAALAAWNAERGSPAPTSPPRIAVLPFVATAGDPTAQDLATRVTEGVTAKLVSGGSFSVVSSQSARSFAGSDRPSSEIARKLQANLLLHARLLVENGALRVEAILVDGETDEKFWVESFVAPAQELDALEQRIATAAESASRRR
jgi:TolB-like protein